MKIDPHLLKFPRFLPNDLEGFIFTYPNKFPPIISYYEEVVQKVAYDPRAYQDYANWATKEVWAGFEKIRSEFEKGNQTDLKFLVETDQKLNKLFCYRFWVVNYLFADGPIHEFYVDTLKNLIRKFIDVTEDIEDFENKVFQIQRDLMQTDYADYYLRQALNGLAVVDLLNKNSLLKNLVDKITTLIDSHDNKNFDQINNTWEQIMRIVEKETNEESKSLLKELWESLEQAKMRKSMMSVYSMLTHAVEFREENKNLEKRQGEIKMKIEEIKKQAKEKLGDEEYKDFVICYEQAKNCSMYKDVIGNIDHLLLPLWFGIHDKIRKIIAPYLSSAGHASMFYQLVWYLPNDLKALVMTPDNVPYKFEGDVKVILKQSEGWNSGMVKFGISDFIV